MIELHLHTCSHNHIIEKRRSSFMRLHINKFNEFDVKNNCPRNEGYVCNKP